MKTSNMNKTLLSCAIAFALIPLQGHTETLTSVFDMYDPSNALVNTDTAVTGSIDLTRVINGTIVDGTTAWAVSSTVPFFGLNWTAYNGVIYGAGTHTLSLVDSLPCGGPGLCASPDLGDPTTVDITVGANQVMGHIKFAWGAFGGIDVVDIWNVSYDETGLATFTNIDVNGSSVPGWGMADGPFPDFEAVFNLTVTPAFTSNIEIRQTACGANPLTQIDTGAGNVTVSSGVTAGAPTFAWSLDAGNPDTIVPTGGTVSTTYTFNPAALTAANGYTMSLITDSGANSIRSDISFDIVASTLNGANDSDGDGIDDVTDSVCDVNGNGIADYLDNSTVPADSLQLSTQGNTLGSVMTASSGSLSIGATASTKYTNDLAAFIASGTGRGFSPVVDSSDLATDSNVTSSCVGGCYDFIVSGLNVAGGDVVNVVMPLESAIPENPVYRKYDAIGGWSGFDFDANNKVMSAPALSTGPLTCPAPGDAAYTDGLTEGNFCLQVTIEDNGPNDANSNGGTIADPGGISTTDQSKLTQSGTVGGVAGGWWLLMALPALFGMRRISKK